ncbi:MAG: hypothetical protein ACI84D_003896, partial [Thalassolituus oleivorans]
VTIADERSLADVGVRHEAYTRDPGVVLNPAIGNRGVENPRWQRDPGAIHLAFEPAKPNVAVEVDALNPGGVEIVGYKDPTPVLRGAPGGLQFYNLGPVNRPPLFRTWAE